MKIKRILSLFLAISMSLSLSGCFNRIPGKLWKNPNLEDMLYFLDIKIGDTFIEEWHENNVITNVTWQKLKLGEYANEYPELSAAFDKYNEESLTEAKSLMYEFMSLAKEMSGDEVNPASCSAKSKVYLQRADNYIVSLLEGVEKYTGGIHPDYFWHGRNYNPATGEKVVLGDVLTDTTNLPAILEKKICEKYSNVVFNNLADTFSNYKPEEFTWTIDYQGITFWFSPYEIAAFSVGTLSAKIWFDEFPDMFNKDYLILPDNYVTSLPIGLVADLDLVKNDGVKDLIYVEKTLDQYGSYNMLSLTVNSKTFTDEINYAYDFDIYLAHMGDKNYIYSDSTSDGNYHMLSVYDISNENIQQIEQRSDTGFYGKYVEEGFETGTVYREAFNNPEVFELETKFEMLGTRGAIAKFRIGNANGKPEMTDNAYTFTYGHNVTSKIPLEAEILPDMEKTELPSGTLLTPYQTDGKSFINLKTGDEKIVRLSIDISGWPRTVNGIPEEECFEDLLYAG